MRAFAYCLFALSASATSVPALATPGDPITLAEGVTLDPILALKVRRETVDEDKPIEPANALTARLHAGFEIASGAVSLLIEGEATTELTDNFNNTIPGNGRTRFSVVADPENLELNRAQIAWRDGASSVTLGRQRIILDDARFVGNVVWRQNEQTFDAVRGQTALGPVRVDATYASAVQTVFGADSPNFRYDGDLVFLNAGVKLARGEITGFAYLLDFDTRLNASSNTFGAKAAFKLPVGPATLTARATLATQSDTGGNPVAYTAHYLQGELGATWAGFSLGAGVEQLGSDGGRGAFQTPLATLFAFNGWADLFLRTPDAGLTDTFARAGKKFAVKGLGTVDLLAVYHRFDSDFGSRHYGDEIDLSAGLAVGRASFLARFASYRADGFAAETRKFWLQTEIAF